MKKYVFKPYSKIFPELFKKEKQRIASRVHQKLTIEHIGSTAVPNLGGKGIIDIAIATDKNDMEVVSKQLQAIGYKFRPTFSTPNRLYLITYITDAEEENRRYHIHLTHFENNEWSAFLEFREYLKNNPVALQEYAELKKKAAFEANDDGEKYRKLKEPIFKMFNKVKIRPATIEDAEDIVEAEREIAKDPGYFCSQPSELTIQNAINAISANIYLVAESDGALVGHAFLEQHHLQSLRHVAELNIAVYLGWQGKGIGTALLKHIIESAANAHIRKIQLNVRATNSKAISLYRKMGFQEEGRLKDRVKVGHGFVDDIIMGLNVAAELPQDAAIRTILEEDIQQLIENFCFPWSTLKATKEKWNRYFEEHQNKKRTVYVLEKGNDLAGYASLLPTSAYPPFKEENIPEINDLWIAEQWRNRGLGKMLIQHLEHSARIAGYTQIGLGVGLYADYGNAQKLYFQLGYTPDGRGVAFQYQNATPGKFYPLDDELLLWLIKRL